MYIEKICQYCGNPYKVLASQAGRSKFCSDKCFRANKNKLKAYKCDYCGKEFQVTESKIKKVENGELRGLYCSSQCAKDVQKPLWKDIESLFKSYNYTLLSTEYINAKTKLKYICNKHKEYGVQSVLYNNLKHGYGCKYCGIERTIEARRLGFDKAKEIFAEHDMELLPQPYYNSKTLMKYICVHHKEVGIQYMSTDNAIHNYCPLCHYNKGENAIYNYLQQHKILFIIQKKFSDLYGIGGRQLSYDFYLPHYNMLIEYQGEQHRHPVELFGGAKQFDIQQEHDKRKREYAKQHQITLLEIWYDDFACIDSILDTELKITA